MILALVLSFAIRDQAVAVTPVDQAAALHFCQALTSARIRSFLPLASDSDGLSGDAWSSVRGLFARYDCISISSYRTRRESEWLVIEVEGSGALRNARHERRAVPTLWYLRLDGKGAIAVAKSEKDRIVDSLLSAGDDDARRAIANRYEGSLAEVAQAVAELTARPDRDRTGATALFLLQQSLDAGDSESEAYALCALARLARFHKDAAAAGHLTEASRDAARRVAGCEAIAYVDLAATFIGDEPQHQIPLLEPVIAAAGSLDDPLPAIRALNMRAGYQAIAGDVAGAFQDVRALLDLSTRYGSIEGQLMAYHGEAIIRTGLNDQEGAIETESRTAMLAHAEMNKEYEARSCNIIGEAYTVKREPDYASAIRWLRRAVLAAPRTTALAAAFQINLGDALVRSGRAPEAERYLQPALEGGRAANFMPKAFLFAEHLRRAQGRYDEAMTFARQGIEDQGKDSVFLVWEMKADLGNMLVECGDADEGVEALREAIDLIEARRSMSTSNSMVRARHFATRQWVYASLLDVLVDQQRFDEALQIAEEMKARELDDSLGDDNEAIPLTHAEQTEERNLNQRIVGLNQQLIAARGDAAAGLRRALRVARADLERFTLDLSMRYSRNARHAVAVPPDVAATVHQTVALEYAVLPESVMAFVIRDGHVAARRLKADRKRIEQEAGGLMKRIEERDLRYANDARALYDDLVGPLADLLPRGRALTIIPDGFLWNVPFDALMTPWRRFLAEGHQVAYAPSITMLDQAARHTAATVADHELLALGDPLVSSATRAKAAVRRDLSLGALPDAVAEVRALSSLYGRDRSTILTGSAASEATFKKLASGYRIIHLAAHGFVDPESPLYSAVVLARTPSDAEDGLLEAREIKNLDLHADLIVLSACETARGDVYPGEGVIGLSWAFLIAGCPTTVVSQWKADSRSTSRLMIDFHRHLLAGDSKAEALRGAKLALMHDPEYRHPFYWAPFIVVGDGVSGTGTSPAVSAIHARLPGRRHKG